MKTIHVEAEAALKKAAEDIKRYYDRKQGPSYHFKVGDRVWLEAMHILSDHPMKKLDDKHHGPFKIISKHGESAFKLDLPKTWKAVYPVFNECVLSPYIIGGWVGPLMAATMLDGWANIWRPPCRTAGPFVATAMLDGWADAWQLPCRTAWPMVIVIVDGWAHLWQLP